MSSACLKSGRALSQAFCMQRLPSLKDQQGPGCASKLSEHTFRFVIARPPDLTVRSVDGGCLHHGVFRHIPDPQYPISCCDASNGD